MFAGVNTKSSLKYSYSFDTRKNSEGYAYKVSTETAGLGGNCRHLKLDAAVALASLVIFMAFHTQHICNLSTNIEQ